MGSLIQEAVQSAGLSNPVLHEATGLQADGWPSRSQTRTFQKHRVWEGNVKPAYSTWAEASEVTLPLSHRSPWSAARSSAVDAARTCRAVCTSARRSEVIIQLKRGWGMSM